MLRITKTAHCSLGVCAIAAGLSLAPTPALANDAALVRYTSSGALDATFDGDGKVTFAIAGTTTVASAVVLDSAARVVVAGHARMGSETRFLVARFNSNGSLDTTFATGGYTLTNFASADDEAAEDIAIDSAGRIVLAGHANGQFALARYLANGSLDTAFDSDGKVLTQFASQDSVGANALALLGDGRIVVAGTAKSGLQSQFALARYNSNGSLDTSFDSDGKVLTQFPGRSSSLAYDIAIDNASKIVAVGNARTGTDEVMAIARYATNGALDSSFGTGGRVEVDFTAVNFECASSVLIDLNNRVIVGGYAYNNFALARLLSTGALDTTFDGDGKVVTNFASQDVEAIHALAFSGTSIVAAGYAKANNNYQFGVARYLSNGSLDTSFDGDGKVLTDFASGTNLDRVFGLMVDGHGRIFAVGETGQAIP